MMHRTRDAGTSVGWHRASRTRRRTALLAVALVAAWPPPLHGDGRAGAGCVMARTICYAAHAHSAGNGKWFLRPADACGSHASGGVDLDTDAGATRTADTALGGADLVKDADGQLLGRTITSVDRLGQMFESEVQGSALLVRARSLASFPFE